MKNRRYDDEFKKEAVRLVVEEGQRVREVEKSLGITFGVLKEWITKYHNQKKSGPAKIYGSPEQKIRLLEEQVMQLTREREILKKQWPSSQRNQIRIRVHSRTPHCF